MLQRRLQSAEVDAIVQQQPSPVVSPDAMILRAKVSYDSARCRVDTSAVDFANQYSEICLEVDAIDVGRHGSACSLPFLLSGGWRV
jgi:hypothetical protein